MSEYYPEWTPDCQGKWDYDCNIVSLSCRYWPDNTSIASICIGDLATMHHEILTEERFDGDTEAEVKNNVEVWAKQMIARVESAVRREFEETICGK